MAAAAVAAAALAGAAIDQCAMCNAPSDITRRGQRSAQPGRAGFGRSSLGAATLFSCWGAAGLGAALLGLATHITGPRPRGRGAWARTAAGVRRAEAWAIILVRCAAQEVTNAERIGASVLTGWLMAAAAPAACKAGGGTQGRKPRGEQGFRTRYTAASSGGANQGASRQCMRTVRGGAAASSACACAPHAGSHRGALPACLPRGRRVRPSTHQRYNRLALVAQS